MLEAQNLYAVADYVFTWAESVGKSILRHWYIGCTVNASMTWYKPSNSHEAVAIECIKQADAILEILAKEKKGNK